MSTILSMNSKSRSQARFLLTFAAVCGAFILATPMLPKVENAVASVLAWLVVAIFGSNATLGPGRIVTFDQGTFDYTVAPECAGVPLMMIAVAGVVAYPGASWSRRAVGVVGAVAFVFVVNLVRLLSLGWLGWRVGPEAFGSGHVYWWSSAVFAAVAIAWLAWGRWATRAPASPARASLETAWKAGAIFLGVLISFWILAGFADAEQAYARLVIPAAAQIAGWLFDLEVVLKPDYPAIHGWALYSTLVGALALILATPSASWLRRAAAALLTALFVYATQVGVILVFWGVRKATGEAAGPTVQVALLLLQSGGLLALWWIWARRASDESRGRGT